MLENEGSRTHVMGDGRRGGASRRCRAQYPCSRAGRGRRSHVVFCIPDADYRAWPKGGRAMPSSGPVDRFYFRSLYFREPNGSRLRL